MRPRKTKQLDETGLFDYAVRALSARALTQGELRSRLAARAAEPKSVDKVIAKLKDYGYLNDRRFAETYARLRVENQGFGKMRVLRDLRARRVAPALAEKVVGEAFQDVDEGEMIQKYIKKKRLGTGKGAYPALYRSLLRAGFSPVKIIESLRRLPARDDWIEALESNVQDEVPESD